MELICACASEDGKEFHNKHFGESSYYYIYRVTPSGSSFIKKIPNTSVEERIHEDPAKARSVASILLQEHVQVVISRRFGPNIKRIRMRFAYVLANKVDVEQSLEIVAARFDEILSQVPAPPRP